MKLILLSTLLAVTPVHAQTLRGSIGGEVTDAAKKPLSGASVALVQEETNKKRTAHAGAKGEFNYHAARARSVPAGSGSAGLSPPCADRAARRQPGGAA